MKKEIEDILDELENEGNSASSTVADHIRTVASNGREYRTAEAIEEEASSLIEAAMKLDTTLLAAVDQSKRALTGYSNDAEHDALVALVEALGEGQAPECTCGRGDHEKPHTPECACSKWRRK